MFMLVFSFRLSLYKYIDCKLYSLLLIIFSFIVKVLDLSQLIAEQLEIITK